MDLSTLADSIWLELELAKTGRQHPWRTPVLASIDTNGLPQARTVVLRKVCRNTQTLQFFTDSRSPKVAQLRALGQIQLVFWSSALNWQLRISAQARIETSGAEVDKAWQGIKLSPARQDYLSPFAPGDALPDAATMALEQSPNLAIITAEVTHMDWLSLNPKGHQRAEISSKFVRWLTP
jgi:pyridoxamine 5'-phosphate oxidase